MISKLWRLEELVAGFSSMHEGIYYIIMVKVMNLSKLAYLDLVVPFLVLSLKVSVVKN